MTNVARYAKAVVALALALLGALGTALTDGAVTQLEWIAIATSTLASAGTVWAVPNKTEVPHVALAESVQLDRGAVPTNMIWTAVGILAILALLVWLFRNLS